MVRDRARAFRAGPPLLKAATGEIATDEELGGAVMHTQISGLGEYLAEDDSDGVRLARELLSRLNNVAHVHLPVPRRLMQACWKRIGWPPMDSFAGSLDIFHGTHFVLPPVRSAKRVLTVHDLTFLRHPEYFSDGPLNLRGHRMELPVALKQADAIVVPSDCTPCSDLIELMKVPEERIRVIPEGVEEHFFVSQNGAKLQEVKDRLGLSRPYLVFLVGTPEPRKNLLRTVVAARLAAPDLPLVIIGPRQPIRALLAGDARGVHLIADLVAAAGPSALDLGCTEVSLRRKMKGFFTLR